MKRPEYYVGIDIASSFFYAAGGVVNNENWLITAKPTEFLNEYNSLPKFLHWLHRHNIKADNSVVCMEATGVYGEVLAHFLITNNYKLAIQPPLAVKRAFKPTGHKTDPVDSCQIAEYAYRFFDELRFWKPREAVLEQIKVLFSTREQFCVQVTAHLNALRALERKVIRTPLAEETHQAAIKQLRQHIKTIEEEIQRLVDNDPSHRQLVGLLMTIPGVGFLLATQMLLIFQTAPDPYNPKNLAAYIGICPYQRKSGTSVYSKPTSRRYGPSSIRKLLYLASMSVRTHQKDFKLYFLRKVAEGKSKRLVLNNIANKLLRIMCAVARSNTPYIPNYRSIHPNLFVKELLTLS